MNRARLTDAGIRRLKPCVREYTVRDTRVPALGVRVHPSGTRTFVCHFPARKTSLGPATLLMVDEARRECLRLQSEWTDRKAVVPVFAVFVEGPWRASWVPRCKPSTIRARDMALRTQLLPNFGDLRVDRITPAHVHSWFDAYSRTSPGGANRALEVLRQILNHAVKLEHITVNPGPWRQAEPAPETHAVSFPGRDRPPARCSRPPCRWEAGPTGRHYSPPDFDRLPQERDRPPAEAGSGFRSPEA